MVAVADVFCVQCYVLAIQAPKKTHVGGKAPKNSHFRDLCDMLINIQISGFHEHHSEVYGRQIYLVDLKLWT